MRIDAWKRKRKGSALIYTHPLLSRAVVHNHNGVHYNGIAFPTVDDAKLYAESVVHEH